MRAVLYLSVCLIALVGCASPKPAAAPSVGPTVAKETDDQRAQRLIDHSVDTGESIATAEGNKLICRKESITNTRLKNRKICLTQEQWQARSDNAGDGFKNARDEGQVLPPKGN